MSIRSLVKLVVASASSLLMVPAVAMAQFKIAQPDAAGNKTALPVKIISIVNVFLTLAAIVGVVFIVIGGVRYIISQGDESASEKAKNTILYAVIGLIVIGLATVIANFAIGSLQ
jgi:hypothetical protein